MNLSGLSALEGAAAELVAAVGIAVLRAVLILERRREHAILRTLGADSRQVATGPTLEGSLAVAGSFLIGVPVGLGLSILTVRFLALFFTLPPPVVQVPVLHRGLAAFVVAASGIALSVAPATVTRVRPASELREP